MASPVHAVRLFLLGLAAWLTLTMQAAWADQAARLPAIRPVIEDGLFAAPTPAEFSAAWFASGAPLGALCTLSCLAALLSCACSLILWRRVDSGQEAAKASMYAAGKLFDTAARRFARSQDEAGSAVEAAASAAGQAGQAAARLAAAVREAESRLAACLGEGEARLRAAAGLAAQYDSTAAALPAMLGESLDRFSARAIPAIEAASAELRRSAEDNAAAAVSAVRMLPNLLAESLVAADARGAARLAQAGEALQSRAETITRAAACLPDAGAALSEASALLVQAQAQSAALLGRIEKLAGVLPNIATSLASTAAGQRQLLSQGRLDVESGIQALRLAASSLADSVDEAGVLMRETAEPVHAPLRPRGLGPQPRRRVSQEAL